MRLSFNDVVLDVDNRLVSKSGRKINLQPKLFDLLAFFAQNPNRLIRYQEILVNVWPGVTVSEGSIKVAMCYLRKALGDDIDEYIFSVRKHGYRFVGAVIIRF